MNKTETKPALKKSIRDPKCIQISLKVAEPRKSIQKTKSC